MITIKEIAKKAKVSIGTVDRVLHQRGRVSLATTERIQKIIKDSGYQPNIIARSLSLKRTISIAVLMPLPNQDGGYWKQPKAGMCRAENELAAFNVRLSIHHYNKYQDLSFSKAFEDVLNEQPDGLLLAPVISKTAEKLIKSIPPKMIYLFFDANIKKAENISYIGQNAFDSGNLAAKLMNIICFNPGTLAIIQPSIRDNHISQRVDGFNHFFKKQKKLKTELFFPKKEGDAHSFRKKTEDVIVQHEDLQGIFIPSALCHYAADVIQKTDRVDLKLIGYDLIDKNKKHLKNNIIQFLICQRPETQGYEGIHMLHRFFTFASKIKKQVYMPLDIVTRENLTYYQNF
jgi:LacI family transcriptional regulator